MEKENGNMGHSIWHRQKRTNYHYIVTIFISENKKSEKAVSALTAVGLLSKNGMNLSLKKLDHAFQSEVMEDAYSTQKFTKFDKQEIYMSMNDYMLEFGNLNYELTKFNMSPPDTVLAFKLLDGALITEHQQQMALRLATNFKYKSIKIALKRIFTDTTTNAHNDATPTSHSSNNKRRSCIFH